MNKRAVIGAICAISALFALQGSALTFAEGEGTASSTFSIDVSNAVLQLSVPSNASITLNSTSSAGYFGSTNLNIKISTNNATGYRLSMSVPTTDLTHSTITGSNAPVIPTLSSSAPESTFPANAWGYKVVGDNYNPILLNNTPSSWEADGPTNETTHTMTLAAKVDGTKAAGAYINTLTFQVVANPNSPKDTIIFNGNGADGGTMGNQQIFQGEATKLSTNAYTKTGYAFNGWNTKADGSGNGYGDEDYFTTPVTNTATTVTLYAQWLEDSKRVCTANCDSGNPTYEAGITIQRAYELAYTEHHLGMYEETQKGNGIYERVNSWPPDNEPYKNYDVRFAMQDIDLTYNGVKVCDLVTVIGDQYQALDVRDNKLYYISKLADGKCWMTQNLDLDLSTNKILDSSNTDLTFYGEKGYDSSNGYSKNDNTGVISWTPERSTTTEYTNSRFNGFNGDDFNPYSADPGDWYWIGNWDNNGTDTWYNSTSYNYMDSGQNDVFKTNKFLGNGEHGHLGNYYNWSAAVASNNTSSYVEATVSDTSNDPKNSICPADWRLPRGGENYLENDYYLLRQAYSNVGDGDRILTAAPLWFIRGGELNSGYLSNAGYYGFYFTSTVQYEYYSVIHYRATGLYFPSQYSFGNGLARTAGNSVRCLAR